LGDPDTEGEVVPALLPADDEAADGSRMATASE
jgi:hypothetical protein